MDNTVHTRVLVFLTSLCFILSPFSVSTLSSDVCQFQHCNLSSSSPIRDFCNASKFLINGICCLDEKNITRGLDIGECKNITNLVPYLSELTGVEYLNLKGSNVNCSKNNFEGMTKLSHVWLSESCNHVCPGGRFAWEQPSNDICINQTNLCHTEGIDCTIKGGEKSSTKCQMNGPGLRQCVCDNGYYGYKCLQQGKFPVLVFSLTLIFSTVATALCLMCFTLFKTHQQ